MYNCDPVNPNMPDGQLTAVKSGTERRVIKSGRGEWEAKTLSDARTIACDFAIGVS
jgi:hypothetical protein